MSPVQSNRHIDEDNPDIKERSADEEDDPILREHDALRQGMDTLLNKTAGLWEENLSIKKEAEFWKNEWRGTLGLRTKDLALRNEVEKWKTEWRRISSVQAENVSLKNQVEQLKSESRMAEQIRKELEAKGAKLLRTSNSGTAGSSRVRVDRMQQSYEKFKRDRKESEQEREIEESDLWKKEKEKLRRKAKEGLRKTWEVQKQRIEKVLWRKASEGLRKAREFEKQKTAADRLKTKRKAWEEESRRKVVSTSGRKFKRKKWSSDQEDNNGLEGEDPKQYKHSWQGELHSGKSSLKFVTRSPKVPFRSQVKHFDCNQTPQQRVTCPTPPELSTSSSEDDTEGKEDGIPVPDPSFHDFDASRTEKDILPGQIWAAYDEEDGMPRLYARISRVTAKPFKVCMNWFTECAATDEENAWMKSTGRLITCGGFQMNRGIRKVDRINIFSHFVMDKVAKGLQKIYPRRGQVWAVYKDPEQEILQGIGPAGGPRSHRKASTLKYEMLEILSEFSDTDGLKTWKLVSANGFLTVFHRQVGKESFRLFQPQEMVKFSHGVPIHRIEDSQADIHGLPRGSLELDPASTPGDLMMSPLNGPSAKAP